MTAPILEEWNRHQTRFASRWRTSMMARKKLEVLQVDVSNSLESRLSKVVSDPFILEIMDKDRRLIEAALIGDKRRLARRQGSGPLQSSSKSVVRGSLICWVNPDVSHIEVCECYVSGAPSERKLSLGYGAEEPSE